MLEQTSNICSHNRWITGRIESFVLLLKHSMTSCLYFTLPLYSHLSPSITNLFVPATFCTLVTESTSIDPFFPFNIPFFLSHSICDVHPLSLLPQTILLSAPREAPSYATSHWSTTSHTSLPRLTSPARASILFAIPQPILPSSFAAKLR